MPDVVTWNAADKDAAVILSNSNLTEAHSATATIWQGVRGTRGVDFSSFAYLELFISITTATPEFTVGIGTSAANISNFVGSDAAGFGLYLKTGQKINAGVLTAYGVTAAAGDVIGVALGNGSLWFSKNNVWMNSGSPSGNIGAAFTGLTGKLFPFVANFNNAPDTTILRGDILSFTYSPPSGFNAWNVSNV